MQKELRVAAVQMNCIPGRVEENLASAEAYIQQATAQGAELILLPELMPSGYMLTEEIWAFAETIDGNAIEWLLKTADRFNVYLGFSFLEAKKEDFYNSFVFASSQGKLLGRVRKNPPASVEAYFYKAGSDPHVIETEIGRIGISICYENLLYDQLCFLYQENIDLILSPAAAGRPKPFIPGDVQRFEQMIIKGRAHVSLTQGVPVVTANRAGPLETELPGRLPYLKSSFPGLSSIADFDGEVKAAMGEEEGVIVANVTIGANRKKTLPKKYGKMWGMPVPWYAFIWPLTQRMGEKSYAVNQNRKACALAITEMAQ